MWFNLHLVYYYNFNFLELAVTCEVPQGSMLEPCLFNVAMPHDSFYLFRFFLQIHRDTVENKTNLGWL